MAEHVIQVKTSANVDGLPLYVHEATISLGVNAIPQVTLLVAPTSNQTLPLKPTVIRPSIRYYSELYRDLCDKAEGLNTPGSVNISILTDGEKTDGVELKGWVLAEVGLSSVSATSAPYLAVTLKHPICKLTKAGSVYEEPKSDLSRMIYEQVEPGSFLEIVSKVYEIVRSGGNLYNPPPDDSAKIAASFRSRLGIGEADPQKYLDDRTGGPMLAKATKGGEKMLAAATARFVLPSEDGSSTWDMITGASGHFLINVVQDQENNAFTGDKLVLEPMKPWKDCSITLDDSRCESTDIAGMDAFKLVGVMCRKFPVMGDEVTEGVYKNGYPVQLKDSIFDVIYAKPEKPADAPGRIMKVSAPMVLMQAFPEDGSYGGSVTQSRMRMVNAREWGFNDALKAYCKAVYEITAGSMNIGSARMALGFKDSKGKYILPGNTCKMVSKGVDVYYGYIKKVVHAMSTRGMCSTVIEMSYVRPTEKYRINGEAVIPDGNKNAAYD